MAKVVLTFLCLCSFSVTVHAIGISGDGEELQATDLWQFEMLSNWG